MTDLNELKVTVVKLDPMTVVGFQAFSATPERDAWERLTAFSRSLGLLEDPARHPIFGFNNPDPSKGGNEYGYEFWIKIDAEFQNKIDVEVKQFEGGAYAVTTCKLKDEINSEFFRREGYLEAWKKLHDWVQASKYKVGRHQMLEKPQNPGASEDELILDLYFPIEEK